jgi:hypothetical protein
MGGGEGGFSRAPWDGEELLCASRFLPNIRGKMLPATIGDNERYPQFSEKCADKDSIQYLKEEGRESTLTHPKPL